MSRIVDRLPFHNYQTVVSVAGVVLHRNKPGTRDELLAHPYSLTLPDGIAVPKADPPRLPLLGLRALVESRLRTVIDGEQRQVTIAKPWRLWATK